MVAVTVLPIGLGARNAVARHLAGPDLTTTVLTMSLTGIGADLRAGKSVAAARRIMSELAMLAGAAVGAVIILGPGVVMALTVAAVLLAAVAVTAGRALRFQHSGGR